MKREIQIINRDNDEKNKETYGGKTMKKDFRIINRGNQAVVALTKESQGTMYYRGE